MTFAESLGRAAAEKAAAISPGTFFRGIGSRLGPALGPGALGQTAIGAGLGAAKAGLESGAGILDPNISPEGRWAHFGLNVAGGAAMGNPAARRALFTRTTRLTGPGPNGPLNLRQVKPYLPAIAGAPSAYVGLPWMVNLGDATKRFGRSAQRAIQTEGFQEAMNDPAAYGKKVVSDAAAGAAREAGSSPAAREGMHAFGGSLGNAIGGGIGGSLVGGALGGIAGHLLAGDDESRDYETRRRRERWRTLLGLGGTVAGGVAGPMLLSRYAPNLIPNLLDRAGGRGGAV
jgi:hypothetical protein